MSTLSEEIQNHWTAISPLLTIHSEHDYALAIERLNSLIDKVGADEQHPFYL